jgi:adenylyltransferase/sulfurtransferase
VTVAWSAAEQERYSRHIRLPGFGLAHQETLRQAKVLLVGAGGLGCPAALYLAAAGVGTLGVVDDDRVARHNLQRQILFTEAQVGQPKVTCMVSALEQLNPYPTYQPQAVRLTVDNVQDLIAGYDLIIDGTDNFATRYLLADATYLAGKPLLQAAIYQFQGQLSLYVPGEGPCYRCLFPEPPGQNALAPCAEVGVLGVLPGMLGVMLATEAIKFLTGLGQSLVGKVLCYDALTQTLRHLSLPRDPGCSLCGEAPVIISVQETQVAACAVSDLHGDWELTWAQAIDWLQKGVDLWDVREPEEVALSHWPGAINVPLSQWTSDEPPMEGPLDKLLVVCQRGGRSLEAVRRLRAAGYDQTYSIAQGMDGAPKP